MQDDSGRAGPADSGQVVIVPTPAGSPSGPPANAEYMIAAYVVTAVIVLGYAVVLVRRAGRT